MNFWKKAVTLAGALVAGIGCLNTATRADDYPSRTIAMVVSFPPGGLSDIAARIIADGMSRVLNQTIIIENVSGAGGTIGTARVAMATPAGMGLHVAAPALTPYLRYDSTKEFEPIGWISNAPVAVVARKDFPAKDLKEFIAYVKEHGDGEASPWRYRFGVAHGLPAVHLAAKS
jgi:tripartite-type tricarboxylate transporter receptor subunit TctC